MDALPGPLLRLMEELSRLPSIGRKSAARLAYHLLRQPKQDTERLIAALRDTADKVTECPVCFNYAEGGLCPLCVHTRRDKQIICVVEKPADTALIERTGLFKGVYHILGGALSPIEGVTPDKLRIAELLRRIDGPGYEVILSTSTSTEGEHTALYLTRLLKEKGAKVTRVARGIPAGSDLQFTDEITLGRAIEGRIEV